VKRLILALTTSIATLGIAGAARPALAEGGAITTKRAQIRQIEADLYVLDGRARQTATANAAAQERLGAVATRLRRAQNDLRQARCDFVVARTRLARRLEAIYRGRRPGTFELLVGSRSFTAAVDNYEMLRRIGNQDVDVVRDIRSLKARLAELRADLVVQRREAKAAAAVAAERDRELRAAVGARRVVLVRAQRALAVLITQEQARAQAARLAALRSAQTRLASRARTPVASSGPLPQSGATPVAISAPSGALSQIALCESGGNPRAVSPGGTYRGKYQFHPDTWRALGGKGSDPASAPEAEQDRVAALLYAREGAAPWPVCGR
jgi:peptidoglycan hydrolase CwlO-like protein